MKKTSIFFVRKHKKKNRSLIILYIAGIFLAISGALPAYINSSLIENVVSVRSVGLFFSLANIATFFAMLFFPRAIRRFGNLFSAQIMMLINFVSLVLMVLSPLSLWLFIFFISMWVSSNLIWVNMDIFVESFTKNTNTGKTRATYFTFMNLGWIISPFLASCLVISDDYYNLVYWASALALLFFYIIIISNKKRVNKKVSFDRLKVLETVSIFWKNLSLRGIYFVSFFLNLFFNSAVVFIPIYLHTNLGFEWGTLGIMFSIMLLPFLFIEIPAGIIADKYLGEKEMMFIGLLIIMTSLLLFFFVKSTNPFVWGSILFFSRLGAALIESMRESSFFKIINAKHVSQINFLRTSYPLGYLVGSGLGALILSFYPVQYSFLFLAVLFLFSFYFVYIIKDSK
ncbi:MAG: MFS transporter [Patescibacteria group bacterium]|nr:MFS transporter [Patescibacteria group bacterium]